MVDNVGQLENPNFLIFLIPRPMAGPGSCAPDHPRRDEPCTPSAAVCFSVSLFSLLDEEVRIARSQWVEEEPDGL